MADTQPVVTVFTKSACQQCKATTCHLTRRGIAFQTVDIEAEPEVALALRAEGHMAAPVVKVTGGDVDKAWAGYRASEIDALPVLATAVA